MLTLSNGKVLDDYTAVGIAEGFIESDELTENDVLLAWSWIGKRQMYLYLQGWFGRTLRDIVNAGLLNENFDVV